MRRTRQASGRVASGPIQAFRTFDGIAIAYDVLGSGPPVLLHHGFASSSATNWVRTKVVAAIAGAGRGVVLLDARGHGESDKPHDPAAYAGDAMARDAKGLLDHLGISSVDVVGYSMGSEVAMELAGTEARVRSLVLGGAGAAPAAEVAEERARKIAAGLEAVDRRSVTDPTALAFRNFAEATGSDLRALAAVMRARRPDPGHLAPGLIAVPTMVLIGETDTVAGSAGALAEAIPGASLRLVPGDHMSAVAKPEFARAIVEFLPDGPPPA